MCSIGNCDDWSDDDPIIPGTKELHQLKTIPETISDAPPPPRIEIGIHNSLGSKPPIVRFYSHANTCDPKHDLHKKKYYKHKNHWEQYEDNDDLIKNTHGEEVCETTLFWQFSRGFDTMKMYVPDPIMDLPKLPCGDIVVTCSHSYYDPGDEWTLYVDNHELQCGGETARYHKVTIACPKQIDTQLESLNMA